MKQKLFLNQLSGRWLAVVLALLLMPEGLLAQTDYGLNVAGVAVTSDNASNVLGDEIVSVSYNNAANTLTLRGAYISGSNITVDESISALTLHLVGQSCIYLDNDDPAIYFANDNPSLTITTSETLPGSLEAANLSNVTTPVYSNGLSYNDRKVSVSSLANTELAIFTGKDSYTNTDNGDNSYIYSGGKEFYASYAVGLNNDSKYAQVQTKKNETTATMWPSSYNYPQLQKVILQIGACTAADVTVQVKGITEDEGSWVSDTTYSEPIALSSANADGILEIPLENFKSENVQLVFSSASSFSFIPITIAFVSYQSYNMTIGGIAVTENNAANITGNGITGSVSYDNETHTLTLNNAYIEPESEATGIDYKSDADFTIKLIGSNTVKGSDGCEAIRYNGSGEAQPKLTFVREGIQACSLQLQAEEETVISTGFSGVYGVNGIGEASGNALTISPSCTYNASENGLYQIVGQEPIPLSSATISAESVLTVAGVPVTASGSVFTEGENAGKVSFNADNNTLTLNGAVLTSGITWNSSETLTVALNGENSITCTDETNAFSTSVDSYPTLAFVKADGATSASLMLTVPSSMNTISGFSTTHEGLFLIANESNDVCTSLFSSELLGGSGTAQNPFIISTANDLKNFASYINESVIANTSYVKLSDDIGENGLDCSTLEFEPIGYGSTYFLGTFDGNNKTIKNLTVNDNAGDCVGFVRILGEGGVIKDLTLDNLTLSGGNSSLNYIGGLVGYLNGGTINNCTVQNSNISCKKDSETTSNNSQNPTVGGIAGQAAGTITNCTLLNSAVNAETFDTSASGANANAGGIVGNVSGGTISGCQVKGTSTVLACYKEFNGSVAAGALFGKYSNGVLSNNTYEYTVTATEKKNVTEQEPSQNLEYQTTSKSGYTQRAIGGEVWNEQTQENEPTPDVADNNGAVMYTKTVTLPEESEQATVIGEDNTYYDTTVISDALAYLVAPGQTVTLNANPGNGYAIASLTATNTTTSAAITTTPTPLEDGIKQYTFTMPDAPVTVAVTAVAAYGVSVAGIEVTELNYTDVLGDGKVSFTLPTMAVEPGAESTPATLTLNGATINGNVVSSLPTDLYIHLQGSNVINAGGKSAFVSTTASSTQTLVFTTNATTPGQLLIKTSSNSYKENFSDAFGDGLTLAAASGKKLIAAAPTMTPTEGLYWTDQQFTVSGPSGSTLYYKNNINSEETAYAEPFTLTADKYSLCAMRKVTVDETEFSLYGSSNGYVVHAKPAFSQQAGTYVGQQNITLTNLPSNLGISNPEAETYPQVWYYLGENVNGSVNISSAEQAIAVSESTKVSVYILDEDSGKVYKSAKVEAEYTILSDMADAYVEEVANATYTGSAIVPTVVVKANEKAEDNLTAGEDYTVSYMQGNNSVDEMINAGDYSIVITGKGAYGGSQQVAFTITKAQAEVTTAPVAAEELAYTGEAQNLLSAAGVANFGTVVYSLASNGEFTATIPQATETGDYNVYYKVLGTDNYDGTDAQSVAVTISKAVVTLAAANQSTTYTGAPVTYDETKITITPAALAEDQAISYTVSYSVPDPQNPEQTVLSEDAPTAVGTYDVTISLVDEGGRYQAEAAQATLTITAAAATLAVAPQAQQNLVFNATPQELVTAGQTADGTIQYKLSTDENWGTTIPTATNKGTYTVSYKVVGDANHSDTEPVDVEVTISAMTLTSEIVSLNQTGTTGFVYDGEAKTPAVTGYFATQKTDLVEGTDFTVAYTDNTNAGTAKATVTGQGNYTGSVELTFTIGKADFAGVEIADIADQPYNNGQAVEPAVTVTFNGIEVPASEYSVAYTANTAVGEATVTLTATGQTNFVAGGTASTTFTIVNRTLNVGTDVTFANGQQWASYYTTTESLTLPEGVMAYIVTAVGSSSVTVAPISYVPQNVPVLIENESQTTTDNTSAEGNLLQGAAEAVAVSSVEGTVYGLYNNKMMRVNKGTIPAGRAYLVSTSAALARELTIGIDTATGIRFVEDGQSTTDQWYTIDGRKLQNKPTKNGLYIKNGKTVVVNNK